MVAGWVVAIWVPIASLVGYDVAEHPTQISHFRYRKAMGVGRSNARHSQEIN